MKILSMTATFGKLNHETLTLEPGLNVIHAPNEWGKSTWCAFIVAMLYGIDTRERSTATALADKERYAPWSGTPMSGRMDIVWNGKKVTLERTTKGRVALGEFRAYETDSGIPVTELTAANCGQVLLGVEKSVFTRSGFVRLTDMPVVQDEALRRRLNALVTTGDESGTGDALAQKLRDLKNKCRHNKTGLLPQAEAERDRLKQKLEQHSTLQAQLERIRNSRHDLESQLIALENHRQALEYDAARQGIERLEQAKQAQLDAQSQFEILRARCQLLPGEELAAQQLQQLRSLQSRQSALDAEFAPDLPTAPDAPAVFAGLSPVDAQRKAKDDKAAFDMLSKPVTPLFLILAALFFAAGIGFSFIAWYLLIPGLLLGGMMLYLHFHNKRKQAIDRNALCAGYGTIPPEEWIPIASEYAERSAQYTQQLTAARAVAESLDNRRQELRSNMDSLCQGLSVEEAIRKWESILHEHKALAEAQQALQRANDRAADLSAAIKTVDAPAQADTLTLSAEQTTTALQATTEQLHRLQLQAGQFMGQKETLGDEATIARHLAAVEARIEKLEDTYNALVLAMETLTDAADELQRRFAPRIASRAQELFRQMTGGRYDRLQLNQDLSLNAAAKGEDALQAARWRSDGTVDQLYLSLRLAVADELTPDAPLVLDDALVRFDDTRMAAAMRLLQKEADSKQVILFTCQGRETAYSAN